MQLKIVMGTSDWEKGIYPWPTIASLLILRNLGVHCVDPNEKLAGKIDQISFS